MYVGIRKIYQQIDCGNRPIRTHRMHIFHFCLVFGCLWLSVSVNAECQEKESFFKRDAFDLECDTFPSDHSTEKQAFYMLTLKDLKTVILDTAFNPFPATRLTFQNVEIDLIRNPGTPTVNPFENLKSSLEVLEVADSKTIFTWDWTVFNDFKQLDMLIISNSPLYYIGPKMSKMGQNKLTAIHIMDCQVMWINDTVFENYTELGSLSLKGNKIKTLNQDAFAKIPKTELWFLDLSSNELNSTNGSMFEVGLPALKELYLNNNALKSLAEVDLGNVVSDLDELWIDGNEDMSCESTCWISQKATTKKFWIQAHCTENTDVMTLQQYHHGTNKCEKIPV